VFRRAQDAPRSVKFVPSSTTPGTRRPGIPTTRRFKAIYVAITAAFLVAALGAAAAAATGLVAAGVWALALACGGMGAVMTAASRQMKPPPKS
jgi:hypothetical protein